MKLGKSSLNQNRGWGYVSFSSADQANRARQELHEKMVRQTQNTIAHAKQRNRTTSLFQDEVTGCSRQLTHALLNIFFFLSFFFCASHQLIEGHALQLSPVLDKRDILFPFMPYEWRIKIKLDSTALFSVTDQIYAQKISQLVLILARAGRNIQAQEQMSLSSSSSSATSDSSTSDSMSPSSSSMSYGHSLVSPLSVLNWTSWEGPSHLHEPLVLTETCACAGGNTLSFARHFQHVHAIEMDPARAEDLSHNLQVVGLRQNVTIHQQDCLRVLPSLQQDVIFCDPPWGGPNYRDSGMSCQELMLGDMALTDLCWQLKSQCRLLLLRVPMEYPIDQLASRMVQIHTDNGENLDPFTCQRPHPFRLLLEKVWLVIFCFPPIHPQKSEDQPNSSSSQSFSSSPSSPSSLSSCQWDYSMSRLDDLMSVLHEWDMWQGGEHRPEFWDWEKQRWIPAKR